VYTSGANILQRSCFNLSWGLVLALPLLAADGLPANGAPATETQPARMVSVVRSDQRTGKLVRSVVVSPKPVADRKVAETVVAPRVISSAAPAAAPAAAAVINAKSSTYAGINQLVADAAARESLPPELIHSVIKVESDYNPNAVSPKGAQGLMQLIPETAQRFGVNNAFSPAENIQGGAKYLRYLLELFKGDYVRALAAYNAGEGAVTRYNGVPPYAETQNYLVQVSKQLKINLAGQPRPKPNETAAPKPEANPESKPDGVTHLQEIVLPDGTVRYVSK
jgi:soluble lytic murein transglycosylase-like protein